eukprot:6161775-Amphidinium_carterae.1
MLFCFGRFQTFAPQIDAKDSKRRKEIAADHGQVAIRPASERLGISSICSFMKMILQKISLPTKAASLGKQGRQRT